LGKEPEGNLLIANRLKHTKITVLCRKNAFFDLKNGAFKPKTFKKTMNFAAFSSKNSQILMFYPPK